MSAVLASRTSALLALGVLVLAGCAAPARAPVPPVDGWRTASSVAFDAGSFNPGKDWMALEVRAAHGPTTPRLAFNWSWQKDGLPAQPPTPAAQTALPCLVLWSDAPGQFIFGVQSSLAQGVFLRSGGTAADGQFEGGSTFSFNGRGMGRPLKENETVTFLFGLNVVASASSHALWTLQGAAPFDWRVLDQGTMKCGRSPRDFTSGDAASAVVAGPIGVTEATNLRQDLDLGRAGLLVAFVGANLDYQARLSHAGHGEWSASWTSQAPDAGTHRWATQGGAWAFEIPHLRAADSPPSAGYIALADLPAELVATAAHLDPQNATWG